MQNISMVAIRKYRTCLAEVESKDVDTMWHPETLRREGR